MSNQICKVTGTEFTLSASEVAWYDRLGLPHSDLLKEERLRRKLAFLNSRRLFWRKTTDGERVFSVYSPQSEFPVERLDRWITQDLRQGAFDFSVRKPFFEQLRDAWAVMPRPHVFLVECSETSVCQNSFRLQHCYEVSDSSDCSRCLYSMNLDRCGDCVDSLMLTGCRGCYECVDCVDCSELAWSRHCERVTDSRFMLNCFDCSDCLFCTNLTQKKYCVFNQQLSEAEYQDALKRWNFSFRPVLDDASNQFFERLRSVTFPHLVGSSEGDAEATGNYIRRSRRVEVSFDVVDCVDIFGCLHTRNVRASLDVCCSSGGAVNCAQTVAVGGGAENLRNSLFCWENVRDIEYSAYCTKSAHLFGCFGLTGREYCIGNKQYSPAEYDSTRQEIVEWLSRKRVYGKFFPSGFSDFPYNHTSAQDLFPLNKYQSEMLGYRWEDGDDMIKPTQLLSGAQGRIAELPATLAELSRDELPQQLFLCEWSGAPYQILRPEFDFYQRRNIAPPTKCFAERHRARLASLTSLKLFERVVEGADTPVLTAFAPDTKVQVKTRQMWQQELSQSNRSQGV